MAKTVFDVLNEKIDEHKRSAMEFLADGGCKDFAHYKNLCGLIQGLSVAKREVGDLMRNFMDDEDND
jgi:hypothetical protein